MVNTTNTVPGMLREYERLLPYIRAMRGPVLSGVMTPDVVPVISLTDLDSETVAKHVVVDSVTAVVPVTIPSYGPYGQLQSIEVGSRLMTSAGAAKQHVYVITPGGIVAGEMLVYRHITVAQNAGAAVDFAMSMAGFGVAGLSVVLGRIGVVSGISTDFLCREMSANVPASAGWTRLLPPSPLFQYPGSTITISTPAAALPVGTMTRLDFIRERYLTPLAAVDDSAAIDGAMF